jgi:putative phosphoribosyl transferase
VKDSPLEREIEIPGRDITLPGILGVPPNPVGAVLFAHGSGSGRHSPRNTAVARVLQDAGLATLLVDLLAEMETYDRRLVFDIDLLAERLLQCTEWLQTNESTSSLPLGYFGASTGAAAALVAAARRGTEIRAVVSRGGRPDLAASDLPEVKAPTLLIVGGRDEPVIDLNRRAFVLLSCDKEMVIVPGATHLFEEPGTLEEVSRLARDWFVRHLPSSSH